MEAAPNTEVVVLAACPKAGVAPAPNAGVLAAGAEKGEEAAEPNPEPEPKAGAVAEDMPKPEEVGAAAEGAPNPEGAGAAVLNVKLIPGAGYKKKNVNSA